MTEHDSRILTQAAIDLKIAADGYKQATAALEDARRGQPASGFGGGGGGHTSSSPVESALGLAGPDRDSDPKYPHPDQAQARLDELATLIAGLHHTCQRIRTLVVGNTPHASTRKDQREVASANHVDVVCEHCTRWRPKGATEPVHRTGDVNGLLAPTVLGLCRFCYDFARDLRRLPSKADIERNAKGLRRIAQPNVQPVG